MHAVFSYIQLYLYLELRMNTSIAATIQSLQYQAASLLLYQSVLSGAIGQAFLNVLQTLQNRDEIADCLRAYGNWFITLASHQQSWQDHLLSQILQADNPFTQQAQQVHTTALPPSLLAAARHDLSVLQTLYACQSEHLSRWVQETAQLPSPPVGWEQSQEHPTPDPIEKLRQLPIWKKLATAPDWPDLLDDLITYYQQSGVGLFARYQALRWQSSRLIGISYPDPIRLHHLVGYEPQKNALIKNTEALLAGYPALHVLLYGSRGSGKSSLVKSLLHEYGDRGLRLIEVAKADLKDLVTITDQLRRLPQKFILFVDDLSFEEDEDAYKALKVVLEGNLTERPQNVIVYATSNRRHLIREFFGDRPRPSDDEVHAWDTVQEKLSFSDRFGLTLTFEPANQDTFLTIVRHLAKQTGIILNHAELDARALQWATRHNGRSGRTARQFVDFLRAELAVQQSEPS
jgi:predicted AAA+ superfamily ATPase